MNNDIGTFRATISTFHVVDHDGDLTLPNSFPVGREIVISAYGHGSWKGEPPIGKGVIGADSKTAWVDGQTFNTAAGRDMRIILKALGPLGQWSYGYTVLDASFNSVELAAWPGARRILKRLDVHEASPVLVGAGIGTRTESIKREIITNAKLREIADRVELAKIAQQLETQMFQNDWRKLSERINEALRNH